METFKNLMQNQPREMNESSWRERNTQNFNTYLIILSHSVANRFPDVTNLDTIDTNTVRSIAEFSLGVSRIALETWNEVNQTTRRRTAA